MKADAGEGAGRTSRIKIFDSHCHLDMEEFHGEVSDILARAQDAGVAKILLAACDEMSSRETINIARTFASRDIEILASVGVHPHEASKAASGLPDELTDLSANERVVAIGEMGLDFFYENSPRKIQAEVFELQAEWAAKEGLPVILHLRNSRDRRDGDAYRDAIPILKRARASEAGGVVHCFSGNKDDAAAALDMGFYVSFAGPVTYPKAAELRDVAGYVPLDKILCETDSPYLAPQGRRGKRNEPAFVREVYEMIASTRGIPFAEFADAVWDNGNRLFNKDFFTKAPTRRPAALTS
ncbi:MAG: TatD family hydrolase [Synergistaceae bacterium]|jgi:TatD DNase family protein|nr:TatD family hydrolase [Synergistaceae bacterium]